MSDDKVWVATEAVACVKCGSRHVATSAGVEADHWACRECGHHWTTPAPEEERS